MKLQFTGDFAIEMTPSEGGYLVRIEDREYEIQATPLQSGGICVRTADGAQHRMYAVCVDGTWYSCVDGVHYQLAEHRGGRRSRGDSDSGALEAPMPGTVLQVRVAEGDDVDEGQVLMVVEAMKMEHSIKAPKAGTVKRLCFGEGDSVGPGELLVELG